MNKRAAMAHDAVRRVRWGGVALLAYHGIIVAILLVMFLHFVAAPWWLRIVFLWIGLVLAGRIEAVLHWTTHFPVFRSPALNLTHRLLFCIMPSPAIWYRYLHFHHHRFNNGISDATTTVAGHEKVHASIWTYLGLSLRDLHIRKFFGQMKPPHKAECILSFALTVMLTTCLAVLDWRAAVLFWAPVTWIGSILMVAIYNYTDHVPSVPDDPYRYATYVPLDSGYQRFLSWLDLHNISTHLTHHRAPGIYWTELPRQQAAWQSEYRCRNAPISDALNSTILFNPVAFVQMLHRVNSKRNLLLRGDASRSLTASAPN
jgi:fatty acid desaturase